MRKKTIKCVADTALWYVLYFLPVIAYGLFLFIHPSGEGSVNPISFETFLNDVGFTLVLNNPIYTVLSELFGVNGILPFFNSNAPFIIVGWYVGMVLFHLAVDFVLFIPKLAQKWLCKLYGGD